MKRLFLLTPLCFAPALALAGSDSEAPAPHESLMDGVHAVRRNDLHAVFRSMLTDSQLAEMAATWDEHRKAEIDPEEDVQFRMAMTQLTAPDAEATLMAMVEPKLEELRPQVALLVGMISSMGQAALAQDPSIPAADKERANRVFEALGRVLLENDITSVETARKAVGVLCSAARTLDVHSLEELQSLSFDQLLKKSNVAAKATKDVLALYGLQVDQWLDSFTAETVEVSGDHAVVRLHYEVLGVEETFDVDMSQVDGRWFRQEVLDRFED